MNPGHSGHSWKIPEPQDEIAGAGHDRKKVKLTTEQIQRIGALSLDALAEVTIFTAEHTLDAAIVSFLSIDNPTETQIWVVFTDGSARKGS